MYLPPIAPPLKIAIVGRSKDTANYEHALHAMGAEYLTTMNLGCLEDCQGLLLPGGGDITPAFFGQKNQGSKNIDTELDIIQLQALEFFSKRKRPVFGICKGMQVINVHFGGTIAQHIKEADRHAWENGDKMHPTHIRPDTFLDRLYGRNPLTNSAHHQAIDRLGKGLTVIQNADDGIIEAVCHNSLPIFGVQWHPERLFPAFTCHMPSDPAPADGRLLFSYFFSLNRV